MTVHDIQIMQHGSLIRRSSGLCVKFSHICQLESNIYGSRSRAYTATPEAYTCYNYLDEASKKTTELALPVSPKLVSHVKTACIKDLRVFHNEAVSKFCFLH